MNDRRSDPPADPDAGGPPPAARHRADVLSDARTDARTGARTDERTNERPKVRHSFDVYRDQLDALQEIQLLRKRRSGRRPTIGELVQQALDRFIAEEYARLRP